MTNKKMIELLSKTNKLKLINIKTDVNVFEGQLSGVVDYAKNNNIDVLFHETVEEALSKVTDVVSFEDQVVHITITPQVAEILSMSLLAAKDAIQDKCLLSFMMDSKNVKCSRVNY
jgi:hypothetical protein